MGLPDQYSIIRESPRRRAMIKARVAVEYRWYWSLGDKTLCRALREERANCATVGKSIEIIVRPQHLRDSRWYAATYRAMPQRLQRLPERHRLEALATRRVLAIPPYSLGRSRPN